MEKFEIIITTLFGLESLVAREVRRLGYETTSVEDGRVTFMGDNEAVLQSKYVDKNRRESAYKNCRIYCGHV